MPEQNPVDVADAEKLMKHLREGGFGEGLTDWALVRRWRLKMWHPGTSVFPNYLLFSLLSEMLSFEVSLGIALALVGLTVCEIYYSLNQRRRLVNLENVFFANNPQGLEEALSASHRAG